MAGRHVYTTTKRETQWALCPVIDLLFETEMDIAECGVSRIAIIECGGSTDELRLLRCCETAPADTRG
ncbi:hypothetical protein [Candidatus Reidiella endopervernicosa]|uniref:Uncharacterized protein n=1 Tax=Candidatus Reidiella endopervernicosa TaxID=2738883 RepID=A0A6N0HYD8_9GAMM|nr:hypothetical protein [Candidatus Reidiella endopervernicosa]QKQ27370.1 hypothetical protein HUE57_14595 [Candidatus Reidiella endopervernicosa]